MSNTTSKFIKVWDPLVRIFHWSLVGFFFLAYLTEDDFETIHIWAGYAVAALVAFRLIWGVIGTKHARFLSFITSPRATRNYIKQAVKGQAPHYLGHNPAGAAMIVALLFSLIATTFFGMSLLAIEGEGPLAGTLFANFPEDPLEEVHEFFANFTLLLVFLHVGGVILSSLQHRENLVRAMFTGKKLNITDKN